MNYEEKEIALQQERFDEAVKYAEANPNPEFPFHFANDEAAFSLAKEDIENGVPFRQGYLSKVDLNAASNYADVYAAKERSEEQQTIEAAVKAGSIKKVGKASGNVISVIGTGVKIYLPVNGMDIYQGFVNADAKKLAEISGEAKLSFENEAQQTQRTEIEQGLANGEDFEKMSKLYETSEVELEADVTVKNCEILASKYSIFLVER